MEETTKILGLPVYEFISMVETILIIFAITAIITIQFFRLRKSNKLFKKLAEAFGFNNGKMNQEELVEKILLLQKQKELKDGKIGISEKIKSYFHRNLNEYKIFVHYTSKKQDVELILKDGFKYSESIYKTALEIIEGSVDLNYKLQLYRPYGKFLIVICIPKSLFEISTNSKQSTNQISILDNVLSEFNPNNSMEYLLPSNFVHSYIDMERNIIFENESFLKEFNLENYKPKILEAFS